jgi:hypothetical protein
MLRIAATFALRNHVSSQHDFSNRGKFTFPYGLVAFVDACFRTKFSFVRRSVQELFVTMLACVLYGAFSVHCFVKALFRAIFRFTCSARYVGEQGATFGAISLNLHSCRQSKAFTTAIKRGIFPVVSNGKFYAALFALFFNPNPGACCATH